MLTISLQIVQHLSVLDERLLSGQKWKVWEGHHLLGKIGSQILVHGRVDWKSMLVNTNLVCIDPSPSNTVRLLEYLQIEGMRGNCRRQMAGSTQSSCSSTCNVIIETVTLNFLES